MTASKQPDRKIVVDRVRGVLDRLVRDGTAEARSDGSVHRLFPVAVGPTEGAAIRSWVIRETAVRTIEAGLGYGISALFVCEGLLSNGAPEARHVVIDPYQDTRFADCGLQFLDEAGVAGMVELHAGESQIVLPRLMSEGRRFDLAVVDGNHRFEAVFVDLYYLGRLLRPGGIVFVDDYHLPGIARAASFFLANLGWSLEEVSTAEDRHHWAVLRTSAKPDTRPFDYFTDFLWGPGVAAVPAAGRRGLATSSGSASGQADPRWQETGLSAHHPGASDPTPRTGILFLRSPVALLITTDPTA